YSFVQNIVDTPKTDAMIFWPWNDLEKKVGILMKSERLTPTEQELLNNHARMFVDGSWRHVAERAVHEDEVEAVLVEEYKGTLSTMSSDLYVKLIPMPFPDAERNLYYLFLTTHDPNGALKLNEVLDEVCRMIEAQLPGAMCSILLLDRDGSTLRSGAAPSLPEAYAQALDGLTPADCAGSCGTAAFLGSQVIVSDIASDPLWASFKDLALDHGVRACWSTPFFSETGDVLGTFAVSHSVSRTPSEADLRAMNIGTYLAGIATERRRTEEDTKQAVSLMSPTPESTADGILVVDLAGKIVLFNQRFAEMWRISSEILDDRDNDRAIGHVLDQLTDPDQFVDKLEALYAHPNDDSFDVLEFKDGRTFERYSVPQRVDDMPVGRVWSFRDVTERKRAEDTIRHLAFHDALTNLPNRALLHDRLSVALAQARRSGQTLGVIFLDLDRFPQWRSSSHRFWA
ncbi:MAG: GAF domain-containing protein, partial [Gemmatimonadetes bacterium]|nr:GAF domain-containing protein [Gemmatimonadota bacterium]